MKSRILMTVVFIAFGSSAALAADAAKKCCCDKDKAAAEHPMPANSPHK